MKTVHTGAGLSLLLLVISSCAFAGGAAITTATLPEQIIQEVTLAQSYTEQANQTVQQIQVVANQVKNLTSLPMQSWQSVSGSLQQLVQLVGNAQGLSYSAQNTIAAIQAQYGTPGASLANYSQALGQWSANVNSQIAAALQQYGLSASNFQGTQQALASIQSASQSAVGRMQVMQAGNQIAGLMVNQMQSLQSDIQAGNQAAMNFMAMQANARAHESDDVNNWRALPATITP